MSPKDVLATQLLADWKAANNLKLAFQLVPAFSGNSEDHSHVQLDYSREMTKRFNNHILQLTCSRPALSRLHIMAFSQLAGSGADCGPSNPMAGLMKQFHQDRSLQQVRLWGRNQIGHDCDFVRTNYICL